jgi:hypothetical protein
VVPEEEPEDEEPAPVPPVEPADEPPDVAEAPVTGFVAEVVYVVPSAE